MCCEPWPATRRKKFGGCGTPKSSEDPDLPRHSRESGNLGWQRPWTPGSAGVTRTREEPKLSEQGSMNGAEWLARALTGAGTTHVFFVESVLRRTLLQLKDLGVTPVLAHTEKAAAYMADGYARIAGLP